MVKVFYEGKEINVNDLSFKWEDHFGLNCSGDLIDYISSKVDEAICEFEYILKDGK